MSRTKKNPYLVEKLVSMGKKLEDITDKINNIKDNVETSDFLDKYKDLDDAMKPFIHFEQNAREVVLYAYKNIPKYRTIEDFYNSQEDEHMFLPLKLYIQEITSVLSIGRLPPPDLTNRHPPIYYYCYDAQHNPKDPSNPIVIYHKYTEADPINNISESDVEIADFKAIKEDILKIVRKALDFLDEYRGVKNAPGVISTSSIKKIIKEFHAAYGSGSFLYRLERINYPNMDDPQNAYLPPKTYIEIIRKEKSKQRRIELIVQTEKLNVYEWRRSISSLKKTRKPSIPITTPPTTLQTLQKKENLINIVVQLLDSHKWVKITIEGSAPLLIKRNKDSTYQILDEDVIERHGRPDAEIERYQRDPSWYNGELIENIKSLRKYLKAVLQKNVVIYIPKTGADDPKKVQKFSEVLNDRYWTLHDQEKVSLKMTRKFDSSLKQITSSLFSGYKSNSERSVDKSQKFSTFIDTLLDL